MEQQQHNNDCRVVERIVATELKSFEERLKFLERRTEALEQETDGRIEKLWAAITKGFDSVKEIVAEHARDDSEAMHKIENALLARVPAWALGIMTVGGSMIGAMASYILTRSTIK